MNNFDVDTHLSILCSDKHVNSKRVIKSLKALSKNYNSLVIARNEISNLTDDKKKVLKENVKASLHKNEENEQALTTYLTTFIVFFVFSIWEITVNDISRGSAVVILILNYIMLLIIIGIIYFFVRKFKHRDSIYQYKLVAFIEDLNI